MFLLSLMLSFSAQDVAPVANRGKVFPLKWEDASKITGMAACSIRPVNLAYAKAHTDFGDGLRGSEDYHYAYLASVKFLSDAPVMREVHEGALRNAVFLVAFPNDEAIARVATGRMGDVSQSRDIIVLLASDKPIKSIECEATTDV